jgi:hypothetical protein
MYAWVGALIVLAGRQVRGIQGAWDGMGWGGGDVDTSTRSMVVALWHATEGEGHDGVG